jgi:hypothetical protein
VAAGNSQKCKNKYLYSSLSLCSEGATLWLFAFRLGLTIVPGPDI